ncbi:MAG: bacillithiol biosynthesis deacetylase BshB1 [Nitrospinae bacterium]|nr:bacillithiol biosynthesis deacetylase BshB1 [Nitrospinota bacterium]
MADILAVGTHPDDIELGLGACVAKWVAEGLSVVMLDLTNGEPTPFGDPVTRANEARKATKILGVTERITFDLPNRTLEDSVMARRKVAEIYRQFRPRMVFIHGERDAHPDHMAGFHIATKARFDAKLTKTDMRGEPYYPPRMFMFFGSHLKHYPDPAFVIDVTSTFDKKIEAILAYESQFKAAGREEYIVERITTMASYFGGLINVKYGEPIMVKEPLGLSSLRDVIC